MSPSIDHFNKDIIPLCTLSGHRAPVVCLTSSHSNSGGPYLLASGSEDTTIRVWDIEGQRVVRGIKGFEGEVSPLYFRVKYCISMSYSKYSIHGLIFKRLSFFIIHIYVRFSLSSLTPLHLHLIRYLVYVSHLIVIIIFYTVHLDPKYISIFF